MTIKTSHVDLKTLAASAAVVGALAFAPAVHAQQTGTGQAGGVGQPGGVGQQDRYGQPSQMGQPGGMGQQDRYGQPSQMGQPGGMGQQDRYGQPSQMGQPGGMGQQDRYGQPGHMGQPGGMGQQDRYGQPGHMGQPGGSKGAELDESPENIRRVQEALKEHGQDLEVDGDWGPRTSSAVQKFQQEQGLDASGKLDSATLQALGVAEQVGSQEGETSQDRPQRDQQQ